MSSLGIDRIVRKRNISTFLVGHMTTNICVLVVVQDKVLVTTSSPQPQTQPLSSHSYCPLASIPNNPLVRTII